MSTIDSMLALSAAWLLLVPLAQDCPHCVVRKGQAQLCVTHAAEERRVLTAERNRLRMASNEADRIAALGKIAHLTTQHAEVPSPKVAEALALGLADDSFAVRLEAVRLLTVKQHEETALGALIAAAPGIADLWSDVKLPPLPGKPDLTDPRQLKKVQAELENRGETGDLLQRQQYYENLVTALARFPDARAEEAVLTMEHGAVTLPVAEAVLDFGSRRSTEKILEWLATSESRAARDPRDEDAQAFVQGVSARLKQLARTYGLPEPQGSERASRLWRAWLQEHGSALPANAGLSTGR